MAIMLEAKSPEVVSKTPVNTLRKDYIELANVYNKIVSGELIRCNCCGSFFDANIMFYPDSRSYNGKYPTCRKCLQLEAEDRKTKNDHYRETKASVQAVLHKLNYPYIDSLYTSCVSYYKTSSNKTKTPFLSYMEQVKSMPAYCELTWQNSEFEEGHWDADDELEKDIQTLRSAKKRFGRGYSDEDYMFLETEYQDWVHRYECNTKTQEKLFQRICFKELEIDKATKGNKSTKDLDKSFTELLNAANVLPRQSKDGLSDSLTFGQLIEKWENEKPIPEPAPEFRDVDGIGKYIRVWFKGHLSRALGLDNGYAKEYDDYISQYTVTPPKPEDDGNGNSTYSAIWGKEEE